MDMDVDQPRRNDQSGCIEDLSAGRGLPTVASLLPVVAGGRGHVLVTSRRYPQLPVDVDVDHPLRRAAPMVLALLDLFDAPAESARPIKRAAIAALLLQLKPTLTPAQVQVLTQVQQQNEIIRSVTQHYNVTGMPVLGR